MNALHFLCPGCGENHRVPSTWTVSLVGDPPKVSVSPSVSVRWANERGPQVCHFWITLGRIDFCEDCTHPFANQSVPLPPPESVSEPRA